MSATMFGLRQKVKKKHWLKHPKALLQKMKFGPKHKRFEVSYFGILFLKILFRAYNFFISIHPFRWTTSGFFFNFRFLSIKSQKKKKKKKKKKNYNALFLDTQELDSWSALKANICIFLYISVRKVLFQRRSKILYGGGGLGGGWIISLRRLAA